MSGAGPAPSALGMPDREGFAAFLLRLRRAGIDDKAMIEAIEATPRRSFIDPHYHSAAWGAHTIPIDCGETVEGLDHQALVIGALDLQPSHRVLEIGTGSGYSAAVMGRMAKRVYTIERFQRLHHAAQVRFRTLKLDNVIASRADGSKGSGDGPFDRIVIWPACDAVPRQFGELLVSGGVLVCPIGEAGQRQTLARLTKVGNRFDREDIGTVRAQMLARGLPQAL